MSNTLKDRLKKIQALVEEALKELEEPDMPEFLFDRDGNPINQ